MQKKYIPPLLILLFTFTVLLTLVICDLGDHILSKPSEENQAGKYLTEEPGTIPFNVETIPSPEEYGTANDPGWYIVIADDALTHSEPSASRASVVGSIPKGAMLEKLAVSGSYMQVEYNGGVFWVNQWLLASQDQDYEEYRQEKRFAAATSRSGYRPLDEPKTMFSLANYLNCRELPSTDSPILDVLVQGSKATVYGTEGSFYLCKTEDGRIVYCATAYFTEEFMFAYVEGAVDLRALMPDAEFDLLFASDRNITGHAMYPPVPLLERTTAERLYEAYQIFKEDGYMLKIYDAYRPFSAQVQLYDIVQDSRFIANPDRGGSWHQHGRAVDMSLVNISTGEELEMPTPMHTFDIASARGRRAYWTEEARNNVDYMTSVMTSVGFKTITTEWWHFEYLGEGGNMSRELNYSTIEYRPMSEFTWP